MDKQKHDYYLHVAEALAECQTVEFELRLYIEMAFNLARKFIDGRMTFTMSDEDYEKASMGKLAAVFRKLTADTQLATDITKFCEKRNVLAHAAIAKCMDPDGNLDTFEVARFTTELETTKIEAQRLTAALHEEGAKLGVLLWFDNLEEKSTVKP